MSSSKRKRRFYRRKRIMIPLVLLLVAAGVAGYYGWQVYSSFKEINRQSTPPPEVSIDSESGSPEISINTGPAQEAVQTWEAERTSNGGKVTPTPSATEVPATSTEQPSNATFADEATSDPGETVAPTEPEPTQPPTQIADQPSDTPVEPEPTDVPSDTSTEPESLPTEAPADTPTEQAPTAEPTDTAETDSAPTEVATEELVAPTPTTQTVNYNLEGSQTFLLMGVDATGSEAIDVGVRPDVLAVLYLDASDNSCRMLRIPRDSRVELPGYGLTKINHALAVGGIPYQMQVVEQFLDIQIDHYGLIDFGGVVTIVDEIGGVEVDNPAEFELAGEFFPVGVQTLNGDQALLYARFRGDSEGDFGRISRQQEVLRAVLRKVSPQDMVSMLPNMLPLLKDHFRTDLDPVGLADLAASWGPDCTYDTLQTQTMQGTVATFLDPMLNLNLSYVVVDPQEVDRQRLWLLEGE